jgi:hypothetical protein
MPVKINNFTIQAKATNEAKKKTKKGRQEADNTYNAEMSQKELIDTCVDKVLDLINRKLQDKLD